MGWNVLNTTGPQFIHCHGASLGANSNPSCGQAVGDLWIENDKYITSVVLLYPPD